MRRYVDMEWLLGVAKLLSGIVDIDDIYNAPSVEIIQCKDCKHWLQAPKTEKGWCDRIDGLLEPTWFCADGERKDDE